MKRRTSDTDYDNAKNTDAGVRHSEPLSYGDDRGPGSTDILANVSEKHRHGILSGIRWSVWVSALTVPFGFGTSILLARTGLEVIAIYGLLGVYLDALSCFVYFGGDSVVMRFIPQCKQQDRLTFLTSYALIILAILVAWLAIEWRFPALMRLLLGTAGGQRFHLLILLLAPLPIAFAIIVATLKALLDVRHSQILAKLPTVITLLAYAVIIAAARGSLAAYPIRFVWTVYFSLMLALVIVGAVPIRKHLGVPRLRFHLPSGFWAYALATELVSAVGFLASRLDYIFVLHYGGLSVLGQYVALMSVCSAIPLISDFFMNTLFPSLTNVLADNNERGAAQVYILHMRTMFPIILLVSCAIMVFASPVTMLLGAKYHNLAPLIILATMFGAVANPGHYSGTLLSTVGRQHLGIWCTVLQASLFVALFAATWHPWGLTGAVVSSGTSLVISRLALMATARKASAFYPSVTGLWAKAAVVEILVATAALLLPWPAPTAVVLFIIGAFAFLAVAGYRPHEIRAILRSLTPVATKKSLLVVPP